MFYKNLSSSAASDKGGRRDFSAQRSYVSDKRKVSDLPVRRPKESEMIFGMRAVIEAIDAGKNLQKILLRRDMSSSLSHELNDKLQEANERGQLLTVVQRVPVEKLNQLTSKNHQGVIAFLSPVEFYRIEDIVQQVFENGETPLVMVLDSITDVRNFGAIARSCACAGVNAVVVPAHNSVLINGDAVKTSAGALHTLPVCRVDNLEDTLRYLRDSGLDIAAATEHAADSYTATDLTGPLAIVMGSEEKGISDKVLALCNKKVKIPMHGTIESLNVSVAAGIMLFEVLRLRIAVEK